MFIILLIQYISAHTYVTHIFDKYDNQLDQSIKYPELYALQHIYTSIEKKIQLRDGRKVICKIPIVPQNKPFEIDKLKVIKNLTDNEANMILFPLEDQCVQHRTKEFLYEYCFKKYIRQYDDLETMLNLQKIFKEDFSLGISQQYMKSTNETNGIHSPDNSNYLIDTNYHQIISQGEELLIIEECVAKLRNYDKILLKNLGYQIITTNDITTYTFNVLLIIHSQLIILETCSDQIIITSEFEIQQTTNEQEKIQQNSFYKYRNLIFGMNLNAQQIFHSQQTLGIMFQQTIHLVQVEKVNEFCLVEVTGFKFALRKKKVSILEINKIYIMDTNSVYESIKGPVWIIENFLFFEWVNSMDIGDYITIFEGNDTLSYAQTFRINQFQSDIAILDKQFTKGLNYNGVAFVKKQGQYNFPENYTIISNNNNNNLEDQEYKLENIELDFIQTYRFLDSNQNHNIFVPFNNYIGITFYLGMLKNAEIPQFFLNIFSSTYLSTQIVILTIPQNNIFIKSSNGHFSQMEGRFRNSSVMNLNYWIVIDTNTDILYMGYGYEIDLVSKMIEFQMIRISNLTNAFTFEFNKNSNQIKILDIMQIPLKKFNIFSNTTLNGIFHPLNYTGQGLGQYQESYNLGSYCKPINSSRSSEVILECYPDHLMKFLEIQENNVCQYSVRIGTYLLCDKNYNIVESNEQHIMCIL